MKTNLRKILPIFVLAASAIIAPAFAYDNDEGHNNTKSTPAVPPAQYPGGEDALAFFVGASYTYWVPYQEGMNVAYADGNAAGTIIGNVIRPVMDGVSGFKVELGANTQHDGWCALVSYTWFDHQQSLKARSLVGGTNYHTPFSNESDNAARTNYDSVSTEFDMQFNRIHGSVDRAFYAGHYLAFRPWIGLLGAWENQALKFNMDVVNSNDVHQFRLRQDWWGIGPYAGVDCTYYLTNEWGIFLSTGGSMLLSNHDVRDTETTFANGSVSTTDHDIKTSFDNVEPMLEAMLGIRWDSFWTDWALRLEAAWELQTYFSHNGMLGVDEITGQMGNYSMQGLTVGLRIYF
ncbi:MAG: hypothetical protein S4CHLAM20_13240 [Chlamydiia bacterium]|nr:hypothetical protein [Chlamydiia bacterium]